MTGAPPDALDTPWSHHWTGAPSGFLNAATVGLPPTVVVEAVQRAVGLWAQGDACPIAYDGQVSVARAAYADLVGIDRARVATGSQTSVFVGQVATSLPAGSEVLLVQGDFTSMTFPFLVAQERGVTVRQVPLAHLAAEIGPRTSLVAFSLVQSADGALADAGAIRSAADEHEALTLVDVTQAAGWMPVAATDFDLTVCSAYKWLCQPRGTAYLTVSEQAQDWLSPVNAGWYAGERIWESVYGPDMRLASDARRFDVSPAWLCWVGAAAAATVFRDLPMAAVRDHAVGLAQRFCVGAELPEPHGAIVSVPDPQAVLAQALATDGVVAATRAGATRLAFHLWNTEEDVDRALRVLASLRAATAPSRSR